MTECLILTNNIIFCPILTKQLAVLAGQMFPGKTADFVKVYRDAVDNLMDTEYTAHLLISCHPMATRQECQLMANIFPPNIDRVLYRLT